MIENQPPFLLILEDLKDGATKALSESVSSEFLKVDEPFLKFSGNVTVKGEASLAGEELLLILHIEALAVIPCTICGAPVEEKIILGPLYHSEEMEKLSSPYSYGEIVREAILIETPAFMECKGGCAERKALSVFFADSKEENELKEDYQPFKDFFKEDVNN